jgi:hypothetical protein
MNDGDAAIQQSRLFPRDSKEMTTTTTALS